jgi:radical SAM protein with 4Fe4S-binding SPASM domain
LVWLRFNISGVEKYDYVMGAPRGSFKRFESIIQDAVYQGKMNGCTIGLQMVLIPECFSEVIPLARKALEWEVDYLVIKQFSDAGDGMPMHFDMKAYKEAHDNLREVEEMSNETTRMVVKWNAIQDTTDISMHKHWDFDRCIDLPFIIQVSGNGKCYPCGYMFGNSKYCYGDITKQRLTEILTSEHYWNLIKEIAETPLDKLCEGQCRHCESLKFLDRISKIYTGNLQEALEKMCGSREQYLKMMDNPPKHINFI